jgi:hypothetical protein
MNTINPTKESTELSIQEKTAILSRLDAKTLELSYETIPHTKVSPDYNICVGITAGTKGYAYMTFQGPDDYCFLMETNKERKIAKITKTPIHQSMSVYSNGTLFYGTILPSCFIIEDILSYQGVPTKSLLFSEKLGFLEKFMNTWSGQQRFHIAPLWYVTKIESYDCLYDVPETIRSSSSPSNQPFHHIQYRCLNKTAPYLKVFPAKKTIGAEKKSTTNNGAMDNYELYIPWRNANLSKPQYRQSTIFLVKADLAFDIYRLYAYGANKSRVYYNVAYIKNYKTSVFMNSLFRRIKENQNLDAIEESDDEEDFQDISFDKYVDLSKELLMEFRFHYKFKKWMPIRVVDSRQKVVHIGLL